MTTRFSRTILFGAIAATLVLACKRPPPPAPEQPPKTAKLASVQLTDEGMKTADVAWQTVASGGFRPKLRLSGAIAGDPKHIAQLGARTSGRVSAIRVALGDRVKRGQTLIEVDTAELHEVTLKYLTALARVRAARDALTRQKELTDERVGAVSDLRRTEAEMAASDAALGEAHEHLQFLGLTADQIARIQRGGPDDAAKSQVRSPIEGQIARLDVTIGQVLSGSETVATVADSKDVWASLRIYEADLGSVQLGGAAEVRVPAYEDRSFPGTVTFVSDVLDPMNRSAELRVAVDDKTGALRPGMSATAFVDRPVKNTELWLPVTALQPHEGGTVVFLHKGERTFEPRVVQAGDERDGFRPVKSGIGPTDEVVVRGAFALRAELERVALEE